MSPAVPLPAPADAALHEAGVLLKQRRAVAAERRLEAAPAAVRNTPTWRLLRAVAHTRLGRIDAACALLQPLTLGTEPWASEASAALADACHFGQRHELLRELLARDTPWARSPRGRLFEARLLASADPQHALALLRQVAQADPAAELARVAGFDEVKLLDGLGQYRQAFERATQLHAAAPPFDLRALLAALAQQQRLLAKGAAWCPPRAEPVSDCAFIVGLPRSGTTLLAQMLDGHPGITAIGEHEGLGDLAEAVVAAGAWPYRMAHLAPEAAQRMQTSYRQSARHRAATAGTITLDKSLLGWRWLPAIGAVLPGAVALALHRDARDVAVSAFLSYLDPQAFGWTAGFNSIRQVIAAERALVPLALQALQLPHEALGYETLVADPRAALQRCLARLGLAMDERTLRPELNPRTAMTLSHDQVRRPLNDRSIGRWRHYAFAFDDAWGALA